MLRSIIPLLMVYVVAIYASHQNYPGTKTRPVLSDAEAAKFTRATYLQGWTPGTISFSKADYTVGSGGYTYIQQAVNAAIQAGGTTRKYIHILKGTYNQIVIIPKTTVPITIYGTSGRAADVVITHTHSANTAGSTWANEVNPGGNVFKQGDPAWSTFNYCATRATIGTSCSGVVWAENDDLELAYVVVQNPSKDGQAVAARLDGDKQHVDSVNFYGFQDTLFLSGKRILVNKAIIKGDVDFIFGGASAVIQYSVIIARGDRPRTSAVVFAPNTDQNQKYGFLLIHSRINADNGVLSNKGCSLARAWDSATTSNGQVVIRETEIDDVINANAPYSLGAGGRAYSGNVATNRNLDDTNYNRFWEYKNTGGGS